MKAFENDYSLAMRVLTLLPDVLESQERTILVDVCTSWTCNQSLTFSASDLERVFDKYRPLVSPSLSLIHKAFARMQTKNAVFHAKNKHCIFVFKKVFGGLVWRIIKREKPLKACQPSSGYSLVTDPVRFKNYWVFNSSNLHARINRRIGLTAGPR